MTTELPLTLSTLRLRVWRDLESTDWIDSITGSIAATPTSGVITVNVNDPTNWTNQTRWEIDSETFLVTSGGTNPISLMRAQEGTVAASHTSNTQARRNPRFLTPTTNEAINTVVRQWCSWYFPQLVWDSTTAGAYGPTKWILPAPDDALRVLRVSFQNPAGFGHLDPVPHGALQTFPAGLFIGGGTPGTLDLGVEIFAQPPAGRTVYVEYAKRWPLLSADTDTVPADFPEDGTGLIAEGAALWLSGWRQMPKFRTDEIVFAREAGTSSQVNFSAQLLGLRAQEWAKRAQQVRALRPRPTAKVWVGND